MSFNCPQCGSPVEEDERFCSACGSSLNHTSAVDKTTVQAPVAPPVTPAPAAQEDLAPKGEPEPAPVPEPAPEVFSPIAHAPAKKEAGASPLKQVLLGLGIFVVVVLCGVGALMAFNIVPRPAFLSGLTQQDKPQMPETVNISGVKLTASSTTTYGIQKDGTVTYPVFKISYPAGWTQTTDTVSAKNELMEIVNGDDVTVQVALSAPLSRSSWPTFTAVADASFKPGKIQDQAMPDLGKMVVARGHDESTKSWVYALLPQSAVGNDPSSEHVILEKLPPSFDISMPLTVSCVTTTQLDEKTEQEVVAMIASFVIDPDTPQTDLKKKAEEEKAAQEKAAQEKAEQEKAKQEPTVVVVNTTSGQTSTSTNGFILPYSSSTRVTSADLDGLSDWQLAVARNEIYARHGYNFATDTWSNYFGQMSWYSPAYAKGQSVESQLSQLEKDNIATIVNLENARNSPYRKN